LDTIPISRHPLLGLAVNGDYATLYTDKVQIDLTATQMRRLHRVLPRVISALDHEDSDEEEGAAADNTTVPPDPAK
jgi:hypothetical protein